MLLIVLSWAPLLPLTGSRRTNSYSPQPLPSRGALGEPKHRSAPRSASANPALGRWGRGNQGGKHKLAKPKPAPRLLTGQKPGPSGNRGGVGGVSHCLRDVLVRQPISALHRSSARPIPILLEEMSAPLVFPHQVPEDLNT